MPRHRTRPRSDRPAPGGLDLGWETALEVLHRASVFQPADAVLRDVLRKTRGLEAAQRRWVSHAVFDYYRWCGFLEEAPADFKTIAAVIDLAERFAEAPETFSDEELAAHAVPGWIHQQMAPRPAWIRAIQRPPRLWLRSPQRTSEALGQRLRGLEAGPLPGSWCYLGEEDLMKTSLFHEGAVEIQDLSSQAVAWVCHPMPGEKWWDACAGEGGKALHLSDLMRNQGLVWASDRAEWRLRRFKQRAARAKVFNYRMTLWNGSPPPPTRTLFDGVLVDAPCSGVGTWQRNPHARWTLKTEDVPSLSSVQLDLLKNAATRVKPEGRLIYSVCTLTNEETVGVVERFNREQEGFVPWPERDPLDPESEARSSFFLWPDRSLGQGMFVACWKRA